VQLVLLQLRVRVWFAQPPGHARDSESVAPEAHSVLAPAHAPKADHAPQPHVPSQVRVRL